MMTPGRCGRPVTGAACLDLAARLPGEDFLRTSCSFMPNGPASPWSGYYRQWTAAGRCRSVRRGPASRSSPRRPGRGHSAGTRTRTSLDRPGARPAGLPTSGTCPRPPGRPSPTRPPACRRAILRPPAAWDALRWLARRQGCTRSSWSTGRPPTAPCSGPARRIRIPPGLSGEQAFVRHLAHQLGHLLLHHDPAQLRPGPPLPPAPPSAARRSRLGRLDHHAPATASIPPKRGPAPTLASWPRRATRALSPPPIILAARSTASPQAATRITHHTSRILHGDPAPVLPARHGPATQGALTGRCSAGIATTKRASRSPSRRQPERRGGRRHHPPHPRRRPCLLHPGQARRQLGTPGYLHTRGITATAIQDWQIGYAPAGWTSLTSAICAASATTMTRSRQPGSPPDPPAEPHRPVPGPVMLPVHDAAGMLVPDSPAAPTPTPGLTRRNTQTAPRPPPTRREIPLFGPVPGPPRSRPGSHPRHRGRPLRAPSPVNIADPGRHRRTGALWYPRSPAS